MATKTAKQPKQVQIIARVQFKSDPRKVCYLVKSSNGKDQYQTCLFDGKATGCNCPATKPCYHMTGCAQLEAERTARQAAEAEAYKAAYLEASLEAAYQEMVEKSEVEQVEPTYEKLDGNDALVSVTGVALLAHYAEQAEARNAETAEVKAAVFQALRSAYDYRLQVQPAPVAPAQPIATRGTLNPQKAFSLLR